MFQIRSEQIQPIRQNFNLSFRDEVVGLLEECGYETIQNQENQDIGFKDKFGNVSWLRYNEEILPSTFQLPSGTSYHLKYYPSGGLQSIQMPNGNAVEIFTKDGNLINLKHKGGASINIKYSQEHKVSEVKISDKIKYLFQYDKTYGYLHSLIDGNKQKKVFNHDNSGNLRQKIDSENRTTYFHYEVGENDLRYIQYPDGSRETYKFDEENNCLEITQRNNSWVRNYYDDNNNLRQVEWQDGNFILLEYDEKGNIASIQNENSLVNFKKNAQNRVVEEAGEYGSIKYEYDEIGNLSKIIYADNYELSYAYDIDGELSEVSDSEGEVHKFTYDAKSSTSKIILSGGNVEYSLRDHFNGQIAETSINTLNGNSYGQLYDYDNQERLSRITDARSKFPDRTFTYDDADHLLEVKASENKTIEKFTYDRSGQMVSTINNTIVIGAMEEVKVYGEHILGYDANGNLSNFLGIKANFQNNHLLESVEAKGNRWVYQYDAFGRRILKTNGKETTQFIWAETQLLEEITINADGKQHRQKYLYRPFESIPFAIKDEKGLYLLQQDHRGAIIRAIDSFGDLVWEVEYEAFGRASNRVRKIHQPWRLQGQYFDAETDLHYNVGRYYSPQLKTYLSRDPRWHEAEASNYNYANNNPYNKADALGCISTFIGGGISKIGSTIKDSALNAKNTISTTAQKVGNAVGRGWDKTKSAVVTTTNSGIALLKNTYGNVKNAVVKGVSDIADKASSIINNLIDGANELIACLASKAKSLYADILDLLNNPVVIRILGGVQAISGAIQVIVGVGLLAAPEPTGLTKVAGVVGVVHGADSFQAGIRQLWTGENTNTLTYEGTKSTAEALGASESTASKIGTAVDLGIGFGVSGVSRSASKVIGAAQVAQTESKLTELAAKAKANATARTGLVEGQKGFGTAAHTEFKKLVDSSGLKNVATEQSYLNGRPVKYGTKGSSRADVVLLNDDGTIKQVFDFKTGQAVLSPKQSTRYINNIPGVSDSNQITVIK
ncbi:RHS repeat domain-containing protein [Emticicia sp. 17c]|uniref:RHS repeat domain-containing protein n=1 Tax=Emticicia sp. 17c TaxID=3127704 RepID=UPI00301C1111